MTTEPGPAPQPSDSAALPKFPAYEALGVRLNIMDADDLLLAVERIVRADEHCVVAGHNLHSIYTYHRDPKMREFYTRARYVFVDGMPLVWWGQALGVELRREHRNTPVDWFPRVLHRAAEQGWRVMFLGSEPEIAARGAEVLRRQMPGLQIATEHGYFNMSPGHPEADAALARVRAYRPQILAVGMGMPRQEHWIADYGERTGANVLLNVGALMELVTGALPTPPRWIGDAGLEWLYRLVSRPDRVWKRYLVEPWSLLPHMARDVARRRRTGARSG